MTTDLIYDPSGAATNVRQVWTFDDMYSAFATTGIEGKTKGQFTRDELAPLAKLNVESLKDYDYFTYATIDGKRDKKAFADPVDYWLNYDPRATVLTLHFTLPFRRPVQAKVLKIEIYDPEFFVDFGFAAKNAVKLVQAGRPGAGRVGVDLTDWQRCGSRPQRLQLRPRSRPVDGLVPGRLRHRSPRITAPAAARPLAAAPAAFGALEQCRRRRLSHAGTVSGAADSRPSCASRAWTGGISWQ